MNLRILKHIVEQHDTRWGRVFDITIQLLIVLSLVTFSIETLPNLSVAAQRWLYIIEVVTVAIFTGEYLTRLLVADHKLRFAFSFFGIIDLLAILPFYIASGIDLRSIRAVSFPAAVPRVQDGQVQQSDPPIPSRIFNRP